MLAPQICTAVLQEALSGGGYYAEIFVENTLRNVIQIEDERISFPFTGYDYGASLRVLYDDHSVHLYTNDLGADSLLALARQIRVGGERRRDSLSLQECRASYPKQVQIRPSQVSSRAKADLLLEISRGALDYDGVIAGVQIRYIDSEQDLLVANSEGVYARDFRVYTRLRVNTVARLGKKTCTGDGGEDLQQGLERFDVDVPREIGRKAAASAVRLLQARPAPQGEMVVVVGKEGGTFLHESCGHALEAVNVAAGSVFSGKLGQRVAKETVTVIDDGTILGAYGSIGIDDEGVASRKNVLIREGVLTGYMVDRQNARRLNLEPTGSGRRENYRFAPTSRMTNTYLARGSHSEEEIIQSVEKGLYVASVGGGTAHVDTGNFDFVVNEAYLIEEGRLTEPVQGATLSGNTLEVLQNIEMIGNDSGQGGLPVQLGGSVCGSRSGNVPVTATVPMLKISKLTVGGR